MGEGQKAETIRYRVNSDWVITWHSDESSGTGINKRPKGSGSNSFVGMSLRELIFDSETLALYIELANRVRTTGLPISFPYRCDSPDCRGFMEMKISPCSANEIEFTSTLIREEYRERQPLLDAAVERTEAFVIICGWCKKFKSRDGHWKEIEIAVRALGLMDCQAFPKLSHGICPSCYESVMQLIGDARVAPESDTSKGAD